MTKHGETDGYKASDFVEAIYHYLGGRVDRVIVNDGTFTEVLETYAEEKSEPVIADCVVLGSYASSRMCSSSISI